MFGRSKNNPAVQIEKEAARKLIHDLRASHHAAKLNADAAILMAGKMNGNDAARLQKLLTHLNHDLDKFKGQLEQFSQIIKNG